MCSTSSTARSLSGQAFTILLPGTSSAGDVVISPSGDQALVTAPAAKKVFLVDLDPLSSGFGTITATIDLPHLAVAAAWAPSGGRAYVVGDNGVATIDTEAGTLASDVLVDTADAAAVVSSPSGNRVWTGDAEGSGGIGLLSASDAAAPPSAVGTVGEAFSDAFGAVRFDLPVTWSVQPALPDGLSFDPVTGVVSGTPSVASAATEYTVTASSSDGDAVPVTWSLTVSAAAVPVPSPGPSTPGTGGAGVGAAPSGGRGSLAATGADAGPGLAIGGLLLAGGLGVWASAARRRVARRG
ncbi:putative Ig domain-containing protein [Cnuibacter sp. UC19_7]|uniref:putative Ig domain-containing protein n=1 Tax=Cnuibacter sp. UC19_7 TaxID=3350166 RepID=UPI00367312FB